MPRKQEPSAMPLSPECKHQLARLVANMIETHLSSQPTLDVTYDPDRVPSSTDDFKSNNISPNNISINNISIKEDCHADHRSTFDQDHRDAPVEDRVCLLASIEHGSSS